MKLFIFIVLSVMLVATTALAGEVPTSRGDKAMVFMFNGLDNLSVQGYGGEYGFGMRYYIADGTAIRASVLFGRVAETHDDDSEDNDNTYGVSAVYEKHMAGPCSSVSPYWGVGAAYSSYSYEDKDTGGDTVTDSGSAFAGFGVMGFEWGFTDCLTFGGECQAGFWSGSSERDTVTSGVSDISREETDSLIGFQTVSVYLSVYW